MPWSRKKSCERCRASKARCNQATPACSRCSERQLQCVYDRGDTDCVAHYSYSPGAASILETSTEASSWARISSEFGLGSDRATVADEPFSLEVDGILPDFDQDLQLDWAARDDLNSGNLATTKGFGLPGPESRERDGLFNDAMLPTTSTHISPEVATSWDTSLLQNLSGRPITKQTSSWMTVSIEKPKDQRTLMRRGAHKSCPLTSMVLGQIVSYPKMMILGDQLPPFIQPPCHIDEQFAQDCAENGKHICLPKDLAACSSLVQMFYQRTAANAPFGWKLIYAEVERLRQEYHNLTLHERLAALQSSTVFLILQAGDSDSAADNGVGSLLATVTEMVFDLAANYEWHLDIPQGRPDRRKWVFRESLRRIVVLLSIIDLLLEGIIMSSSSSCHDFRAVPLPSNRDLWAARTNRGWRMEYASYISSRKTNKVLTVGDLIESDEAGCFTNSKNNIRNTEVYPDVVKWCEGQDALGTLIWMVMPFEQYRRRKLAGEDW